MNDDKKKKGMYWLLFAFLMLAVSFLSFYKLNVKYVDPWDEARHGVNAWEMMHGGSMIQSTYLKQADYYNLKPPLSMWGIMIGLAVFKDPVFGLRFYSAVCYLILTAMTGLFLRSISDKASLFAMTGLCINMTPFLAHMIRAGDADSLYVLLFSIAMLSMMRIRKNHNYLYICGLCFSFAFLTKSFHAMTIAIIGALFLILTGLLTKLRFKEWCIFICSCLLPAAAWAVLRYRIDGSEFFIRMWETDVMGRTTGELKNNISPFYYYFSYYFGLMSGKLQVYLFAAALVITALALMLYAYMKSKSITKKAAESKISDAKEENNKTANHEDVSDIGLVLKRDIVTGFLLWILIPLFGFSFVSNKLLWYQYPAVTGLMIFAGVAAAYITDLLKGKKVVPIVYMLLAFMCVWYYAGTLKIVNAQEGNELQLLIRAVAGDETAKSAVTFDPSWDPDVPDKSDRIKAYIDYDGSGGVWQQQDVFVAEAYGAYECQNGGVLELLITDVKDNVSCILFASKKMLDDCGVLYEDYPVIARCGEFTAFAYDGS
ncbi:MAG: glycosyltransferase family 39 protein [Lachnospiraceae bacterium]|nr:glycosyltransferase family 39 protein [Lachnospiraceae bacterium]